MKRAEGLVELSRRHFCAFAGSALGLAAVGCTDGLTSVIQTGPLGGGDDDAPVDAGVISPGPDAAMSGATCTGAATDVGLPSAFAMGAPIYFSANKFFVVRDAGGLYAVTAVCTHEGAINKVVSGQFRCPRHGALFTFNGAIISGPVSRVLVHYSMCTLANGHLGVTTAVVAASTRLVV